MFAEVTPEQEARAEAARRSILDTEPWLDEPGLLERVGQWLLDRITELLAGNVDDGSTLLAQFGRFLDAAMPWLLVGLVTLAGWWVWRHRNAVAGGAAGDSGDAMRVGHVDEERSAAEWLRECRRLADEGRHPEAVRAAYRAIVVHLVARELVPATPGLTVGAHRSLVGRSEVLDTLQAEGFAAASDVFERAWYGTSTPAGGQSGAGMSAGDDPAGEVDRAGTAGEVDGGHTAGEVDRATATAQDVAVVLAAAERLGVGR